jgi:4-amino-4-deoxy-L-arabinose transferase-like glycosyltransferase
MDSNARVGPWTALVLALALHAARPRDRPMADEAWFASPAWNLARHGSMHTSVLEPRGTYWEGIDRYTYWIPPAYPVMLAGWFKLAGMSPFTMRALSVVFGCAVVLAIFLIVGRLTPDRWAAALASLFVASDFALVRAGALGRTRRTVQGDPDDAPA